MSETPAAPAADGILVVQSKVREIAKTKDFRVSEEFVGALSDEVRKLIEKAAERATANGRKTLQKSDV